MKQRSIYNYLFYSYFVFFIHSLSIRIKRDFVCFSLWSIYKFSSHQVVESCTPPKARDPARDQSHVTIETVKNSTDLPAFVSVTKSCTRDGFLLALDFQNRSWRIESVSIFFSLYYNMIKNVRQFTGCLPQEIYAPAEAHFYACALCCLVWSKSPPKYNVQLTAEIWSGFLKLSNSISAVYHSCVSSRER